MFPSARSLTFRSALGRARAHFVVLWLLVAGALRLGWFLVCQLHQLGAAVSLLKRVYDAPLPGPESLPLRRVAEGVHSPGRQLLERDARGPVPVVLHFTGTGEGVHSAFEATHRLCGEIPELSNGTYYLFEAPFEKGAYYGPQLFAGKMWQRVATIVEHYEGPFVVVGLSRGGLVALDVGMRIVSELGKSATVLALSAPVDIPRRLPRAARTIASFEHLLEGLEARLGACNPVVRSSIDTWVRGIYALMTALILSDFGVLHARELQLSLVELDERGVIPGCLRAAREFRLLTQVTRRDSQHFCQQLASTTAHNGGKLHAALLWGEQDSWIDAKQCQARVLEARASEPSHGWLETALIPGQNHALGRERQGDHAALAHWLQHVARRASATSWDARLDETEGAQTLQTSRASRAMS